MNNHLQIAAVSRNYFNMPLWVAQACGFFERERLSLDLNLIEGIDRVTEGLASGQFQIDLGVTENVILNREHGGRLEVIGGNVNRLPFSLIAHPSIKRIADLRGKRIGVSSIEAGSSSLVMKMLAEHGLNYPNDYVLLPVGPILTRWAMLQSGEIEAGLQGAPMNQVALEAGYNNLGRPSDMFPDFQFTSVNVDSDWASQNRDTVVAFLRAYVCACQWLAANREASREIAGREANLPPDHADFAWQECVRDGVIPADGRADVKSVQTLIEVSSQIRALPGRRALDASSYINPSYLDATNL
ncbi:MAG: ABC transporter substrate-binding protein [Xanthobacteraceae bacterium]